MPRDPATNIGARLRRVRRQQNLSLADVEELSGGAWKAVVVGAYERGDRAVSIARLARLAEFYGVPLADLLPGTRAEVPVGDLRGVVLDLRALEHGDEHALHVVARFAEQIRRTRGDHNGRVLSLRASDVEMLALMAGTSTEAMVSTLRDRGALAVAAAG